MKNSTGKLFLCLLIVFIGIACHKQEPSMKNEIEARVRSALPAGTSYEAVESYFQRAGIEHSWAENGKVLHGIIRNISKRGPVSESIQVVVHMDNEKKVEKIEIKSVFTGP